MATPTTSENLIGFRSGMYKSCSGCAGVALGQRTATGTAPQAADTWGEPSLAKREIQVLPDGNFTLICLAGELWLTRVGDGTDYILGPGESLALRCGDQAFVQALQPSRTRILTA